MSSLTRTFEIDDITPEELAELFAHLDARQQAHFFSVVGKIADAWPGAGWCQQCCSISQHLDAKAAETILKLSEWAADPYLPAQGPERDGVAVSDDGKLTRLPDELAEPYTPDPELISREIQRIKDMIAGCERSTTTTPESDGVRIWLWRNGPHEFVAYDNPFPTQDGGDPLTLGEPAGWASLHPSVNGRPGYPVEQVERDVARTSTIPTTPNPEPKP